MAKATTETSTMKNKYINLLIRILILDHKYTQIFSLLICTDDDKIKKNQPDSINQIQENELGIYIYTCKSQTPP